MVGQCRGAIAGGSARRFEPGVLPGDEIPGRGRIAGDPGRHGQEPHPRRGGSAERNVEANASRTNMSLRREQLLGYLLGALEPEERAEVERELAANPRLGQELAEIRDVLEQVGMTERPEPIEPPAGLVDRTCDLVAAQSAEPAPVGLPPDRSAGGIVRYYTLTDVLVAASVLL